MTTDIMLFTALYEEWLNNPLKFVEDYPDAKLEIDTSRACRYFGIKRSIARSLSGDPRWDEMELMDGTTVLFYRGE